MNNNSKKNRGFTLIEVVISMAIISILSVGAYNAYLLLIRQTKAGQVKQTATLIGKKISEDIKSALNTEFNALDATIDLTDKIQFAKYGNNYRSTQNFDEEGNPTSDEYRYISEVELVPKITTPSGIKVSIDKFSADKNTDVDNYNVYIIKSENGEVNAVTEPTNSSNIQDDKTIEIGIKDSLISKIIIDSSELNYTFNKEKIQISIDLKYCTGLVTIEVNNETTTPLNLCVLNNKNVTVKNIKGVLNEYYRSDEENKIGTLYEVNIKVFNAISGESRPEFQTSFVQNIDIR